MRNIIRDIEKRIAELDLFISSSQKDLGKIAKLRSDYQLLLMDERKRWHQFT